MNEYKVLNKLFIVYIQKSVGHSQLILILTYKMIL